MNADEFLERTTDPEVRILSSLIFSRSGRGGESVKKAEMLIRLKGLMAADIVHFVYLKSDGTLRSAYGTRDPALIRERAGESGREGKDRPLRTFTYYDIVRDGWRAFRPESIVRIDDGYTL